MYSIKIGKSSQDQHNPIIIHVTLCAGGITRTCWCDPLDWIGECQKSLKTYRCESVHFQQQAHCPTL